MILHKLRNLFTERLASISLLVPLAAAAAILTLAPPPVLAQGQPQGQQQEQFEEEDEEGIEEIVVTGSRIRRSSFSGAVPLQVITAEGAFEAGLIETSEVLQSASQATGINTDSTFVGFVNDSGPTSSDINLRGLGAGRTLILINGKRMASAGIGGAPVAPDTSLIPNIITQRTELLLDGASSIYGSDAVTGVINIITRKDFDGFEIRGIAQAPALGGRDRSTLSAIWGTTGDNYSLGFAAESFEQQRASLAQRPFFGGCERAIYEGTDGEEYTNVAAYRPDLPATDCPHALSVAPLNLSAPFGETFVWWRTPGTTNFGVPNWSIETQGFRREGELNPDLNIRLVPIDSNVKNNYLRATDAIPSAFNCVTGPHDNFCRDADGNPIPFRFVTNANGLVPGQTIPTEPINPNDFNGLVGNLQPDGSIAGTLNLHDSYYKIDESERAQQADVFPEFSRRAFYAYGEYDFGDEAGTKLNVDFSYSRRDSSQFTPVSQIAPRVPANNPYNPCNVNTDQNPDGMDCNEILYIDGTEPSSLRMWTFVSIRGDREQYDSTIEQYRSTVSLTGDILSVPGNWFYEVYGVYTTSQGEESRVGIVEGALELALHTAIRDPATGDVTCGKVADWYGFRDTLGDPATQPDLSVPNRSEVFRYLASKGITDGVDPNCVPVNLHADDIYLAGGGRVPEDVANYIFDSRDFDTRVSQSVAGLIVQGNIGNLPWNDTPIPLVLGYEYRQDEIESLPDDNAALGLTIQFFVDRGATGNRDLNELFAETSLDLLVDRPFAQLLRLEAAYRHTEESTYGSGSTYSIKGQWQVFDWLTLRSTYGTSFRAPNAREQFLLGTGGFNFVNDPCVVPLTALDDDPETGDAVYNADNDARLRGQRVDPDDPESRLILDVRCEAHGIDFQNFGIGNVNGQEVQALLLDTGGVAIGGAAVNPEVSTSETFGIVIDQDIWEDFELRFALTYYDINVTDAIASQSSQGILNSCYLSSDPSDLQFCNSLKRNPDTLRLEEVNTGFFNVATDTASGFDFNMVFEKSFIVNDRALDFNADLRISHILESFSRTDPSAEPFRRAGTARFPENEGNITFNIDHGEFRYTWFTRFIQGGRALINLSTFADAPACAHVLVQCRGVDETEDYLVHNFSVRWLRDNLGIILGINNVFNVEPPLFDTDAGTFNIRNNLVGRGYDFDGRTVTLNVQWNLN